MEKPREDQVRGPKEPVNDSEALISVGAKSNITSCVSPKKIQLGIVQSSSGNRSCMGNVIKKSRWDQGPEPGDEIQESQDKIEDKLNVKSLIKKFEDISGSSKTSTDIVEDEGGSSKPVDTPTPSRVKLVRTNFMKTDQPLLACKSDALKTDNGSNLGPIVKSDCSEASEITPVAASKALQIISSYYDSPTDDSSQEGDIKTFSENNTPADNGKAFISLNKDNNIENSSLLSEQQLDVNIYSSTSTEKTAIICDDIKLVDEEKKCLEVNDPVMFDKDDIKVSKLISENPIEENEIKNVELNRLCVEVSSNDVSGGEAIDVNKTCEDKSKIVQLAILNENKSFSVANSILEASLKEEVVVTELEKEHPVRKTSNIQENMDTLGIDQSKCEHQKDICTGNKMKYEENLEVGVVDNNMGITIDVSDVNKNSSISSEIYAKEDFVGPSTPAENVDAEINYSSLNILKTDNPSTSVVDSTEEDFVIVSYSDIEDYCDKEVESLKEEQFSNETHVGVESGHNQDCTKKSQHNSQDVQKDNSGTPSQSKSDECFDESKLTRNDLYILGDNEGAQSTSTEVVVETIQVGIVTNSDTNLCKLKLTYNDSVDATMEKMFSENSGSLKSDSLPFVKGVDSDDSTLSTITSSQNEKVSTEIIAEDKSQHQLSNAAKAAEDGGETNASLLKILETDNSIASTGYEKETPTTTKAAQQEEIESSTETLNVDSVTDLSTAQILENTNMKNDSNISASFSNKVPSELLNSNTDITPDDSTLSTITLTQNEDISTKIAVEENSQNQSTNAFEDSAKTNDNMLEILVTDNPIAKTGYKKDTPTTTKAAQQEEIECTTQTLNVDSVTDINTAELLDITEEKSGLNSYDTFSNKASSELLISSIENAYICPDLNKVEDPHSNRPIDDFLTSSTGKTNVQNTYSENKDIKLECNQSVEEVTNPSKPDINNEPLHIHRTTLQVNERSSNILNERYELELKSSSSSEPTVIDTEIVQDTPDDTNKLKTKSSTNFDSSLQVQETCSKNSIEDKQQQPPNVEDKSTSMLQIETSIHSQSTDNDLNKLMIEATDNGSKLSIVEDKEEATERLIETDLKEIKSNVEPSETSNIEPIYTNKPDLVHHVVDNTEELTESSIEEPDIDLKLDKSTAVTYATEVTYEQENKSSDTINEDKLSKYQPTINPNERTEDDKKNDIKEQLLQCVLNEKENKKSIDTIESIKSVASPNLKKNMESPTKAVRVEVDSLVNLSDTTRIEQCVSYVDDSETEDNTANSINNQLIVGAEMKSVVEKQDRSLKNESGTSKLLLKCKESEIPEINATDILTYEESETNTNSPATNTVVKLGENSPVNDNTIDFEAKTEHFCNKQTKDLGNSVLNDIQQPTTDIATEKDVDTIFDDGKSSNKHSHSSINKQKFSTKTEILETVNSIDQPSKKHLEEYTVDNLKEPARASELKKTNVDLVLQKSENQDVVSVLTEKDLLHSEIGVETNPCALTNPDNSLLQQSIDELIEVEEVKRKSAFEQKIPILTLPNYPELQSCGNGTLLTLEKPKMKSEEIEGGKQIDSQSDEQKNKMSDTVVCEKSEAETIEAIDRCLESNQTKTELIKSNDPSLTTRDECHMLLTIQSTNSTVIESEIPEEQTSTSGKLELDQDFMIQNIKSHAMILENEIEVSNQSHAEKEDKRPFNSSISSNLKTECTSDKKLESISQQLPKSNKEISEHIKQTKERTKAVDVPLKIAEQLGSAKDDTVNVNIVHKGENSSKIKGDVIPSIEPVQVTERIELENVKPDVVQSTLISELAKKDNENKSLVELKIETKVDIQNDSEKMNIQSSEREIKVEDDILTKKRPAPVSNTTVHSGAKGEINIPEMPPKRLKTSSNLSNTEKLTEKKTETKEVLSVSENEKQVKKHSVTEGNSLTKEDSSCKNDSELTISSIYEYKVSLKKDFDSSEKPQMKDSISHGDIPESKTNIRESGQPQQNVEFESTNKSLLTTVTSNDLAKPQKSVQSKEIPAPVRVSARQKQRQAAAAAALAAEKAKLPPESLVKKGSPQDKNLDKRGKKTSVSPTKELGLNIKISTGKHADAGKQSPSINQKSPRTPELKSLPQTLLKKTPKELSQDKLEPITLKLSKEDNPVIIRSSSLSPKKVPSPASPQKTLGYTLKIGKDSTTIIPKDPTHSPKVRDSSPQSTNVKSDLSGNVGYLIKDTGLTITPIAAAESHDQKLSKITLKLSKAGGHPEIKQEKSETWKAIKKLGEIDIVPVEGKSSDSSGAREAIDKVSPDNKFKVGDVMVEPTTSSGMSKLQGLLTQAPLNQSEDSEDVQFVGFGTSSSEKVQTEQNVSYDIGVVKQESDLHATPRRRGRPRKMTTPDMVRSLPPGVTAKDILAASLQRQTLQQHLQQIQKPLQMPDNLQISVQEQESSQPMFPVPLFDLSEDTFMDPSPPTIFPDQVGLQPDMIMRSARGRPIGRSRRPRGSGPVRGERGGPRGRPRGSRGIKRMIEEMEAMSYPDMDEPITLDNIDSQIGPRVSEQSGSQITEKTMALLRKSIEGKKENLEKKVKRSDEEGNRDIDAEVIEMKEKIEAAYKAELKSPEKDSKNKTPDKTEVKSSCKKEPPELIPIQTSVEKTTEVKHNFQDVGKESLKRKLSEEFSTDEISKKKSLEADNQIADSKLHSESVISLDLSCDDMDVDQPASPEDPDQSGEVQADPDPPPKPVKPRPKSKAEIKRIKREKDRIRREAKKLAALEALKAPPPNPSEEDTRMSATDPNGDIADDGSGIKKSRLEVGDTDAKEFTVEQIAEYQWPLQGGELYMIQEQVSTYLGVKSFKRKYPDLKRRPVEMEERTFLCDSGLVSEAMCDLGLTAVSSSEVLDIMFQDFQDKYEELRKHMREKQARELINKQKERKKFEQSLSKSDLKEQAIQSSLTWNQALNRSRNESRRCHLDLQTWTIQYPRSRALKMTRSTPKLGNYPLALIPGQFSDYYKRYTPQELRYWPVNTVLYGPLQPNERNSTGGSDGSQSESEDSSSSDDSSDSSSEGEGTEEEREKECKACGGGKRAGEMVQCAQCSHNIHVSCADLNPGMLVHVRKYSWQCSVCKICQRCNNAKNESKMLFCDVCDRGYHSYCVGLRKVPSGSWSCQLCAADD